MSELSETTSNLGDDFSYDEGSAQEADRAASVLETAAYPGTIISAVLNESENTGSRALRIMFKSDEGGQGRMDIWYKGKSEEGNKPLAGGMSSINGILRVLGLKALKGIPAKVEGYEDGKKVEKDGISYPGICNKPIGILIQKELTTRQDGKGDSHRYNFVLAYDLKTGLTSSELINGETKPKKLAKAIHNTHDKDSRTIKNTAPTQSMFGGAEADDMSL